MLNLMLFLNQDLSYIPLFVGLFELVLPRNGKFETALDQILSIPENVLFTLVHKNDFTLLRAEFIQFRNL